MRRFFNSTFFTALAVALIVVVLFFGSGCFDPETHFGPEITEPAEIYDACYVPAGHGHGSSIGITTNVDVTISSSEVHIPARYAIVFRCQHGKFVIDGARGKNLYNRFSRGDLVTVKYCEVIQSTVHGNTAVDLHFFDAVPRSH